MKFSVSHFINLMESETVAPFSGAENHLWVLLPALNAAGVRVELCVLLQQTGARIEDKLAKLRDAGIATFCFNYHPASARSVPFYPLMDLSCIAAVRRHLKQRRDWIVHTHLDPSDANVKIAARLAGCAHVVSTVHNNEPAHLRRAWFCLQRLLDRFTSRHIAISKAVARHLVELEKTPASKVSVIPYGISPPPTVLNRVEARSRLGLRGDMFTVGFVGRLTPQKNVGVLIEAMKRMPSAECVIVGEGELRKILETEAAGAHNIKFVGHRADASELMPAFDVLCLPSKWEGLGLVLIEAMLRGVPVAGSRAGAIPEILDEGRCGTLFDGDDVDSLIQAIEAARSNGGETAARARAFARETFTVEKMTRQTLQLYQELTSTGN